MTTRRNRSDKRKYPHIYCTWGRHYTIPSPHIRETYDEGTICLICQLKIMDELVNRVDFREFRHMLTDRETTKDLAKVARRRVARKLGDDGFVYYMRMNGQIKIGFAHDVTKRMRAYPPETELLAVEPGTLETERDRHIAFHGELVRGREWFRETPRLVKLIEDIRTRYGSPAALAYEYTRHE